jgi:DNA-binding winged helix-turn-helix (wHTH) protein
MGTELVFAQTQGNAGVTALGAFLKGRFVRFGDFHVDLKRKELFRDSAKIKLPGKVYQALEALLEQPGEIVTREALRMRLWPEGTHVNYDANVNTTVNKLRQALGDSPGEPRYVETIPKQGYSFVARVEKLDNVPPIQLKRTAIRGVDEASGAPAENHKGDWFPPAGLTAGWVKAGAVALLIAGMLIGAAVAIYAYHVI